MNSRALAVKGKTPIATPALQTFEKHESALTTWSYDKDTERGQTPTLYPLPEVGRTTNLIPKTECMAVVLELETALQPADYGQARGLAETILGRYAKRDLYDIDTFVFEMTRLFAEAPADLGQQACDQLRGNKFLPNVGDVSEILRPLVNHRVLALAQARKHLSEHDRRDNPPNPPPTPEHRKAMGQKLEKLVEGLGGAAPSDEPFTPKNDPLRPNPDQLGAKGLSSEEAKAYWNEKLGVVAEPEKQEKTAP